MIYIIGAISIISLVLNVLIYRKVMAADALITFQELAPETIIEPQEREAEPEVEPVQPVTTTMVQEVYQGWRNQKGIPAYEPITPPAPVAQPKVRGPLERPDGFV